MQQDADFITVDFLYMFRASCAHHHEYKIRQPPVKVVMVAGGSSLRHTNVGTEYFKYGIYSPFFFSLQNAVCFIILTYLVLYYSHFI